MVEGKKIRIIRSSTVPTSINTFCRGLLRDLQENEGYEVVAVSSSGEALDEIAQREGVKVYAVDMERHISPLKDLKSLWKMIRLFRKIKPDFVHSITPKAGLLCMMAAKVCGVPVRLHNFTGLVFPTATGLKQKILILTDRLTCACATHILPEGEGVKADLVNFKITRKPLKVLGHGNIRGIDTSHFDPELPEVIEKAEKIKDSRFTFLFVGRITRDKGINELVSAFSRLHGEMPDTRLILVGRYESTLDPLLPETVREIEENDAIEFVGMQSDVRPWMLASDALVFPSYREGFPNVVIEAGAMGLPSVVTDINGSREIIIDGENGVIIPPKNPEALFWQMKRFASDPDLAKRLGENARPLIKSRYEQDFVRNCLKTYYREILQKIK